MMNSNKNFDLKVDVSEFPFYNSAHMNRFSRCIKKHHQFCSCASNYNLTRVFCWETQKVHKLQHSKALIALVTKIMESKKPIPPFLVLVDLDADTIGVLR